MDDKQLFEEYITGKDIIRICEEVGCSKSTAYKYLNGEEPETNLSKRTYQLVLDSAKKILIERGKLFLTLENKTDEVTS
jgi:predicted transcriptional regulator